VVDTLGVIVLLPKTVDGIRPILPPFFGFCLVVPVGGIIFS